MQSFHVFLLRNVDISIQPICFERVVKIYGTLITFDFQYFSLISVLLSMKHSMYYQLYITCQCIMFGT